MSLVVWLWGSQTNMIICYPFKNMKTVKHTSDVEGKKGIFNQCLVKVIRCSVRESKSIETACYILFTAPASLRIYLYFCISRKFGNNKYNPKRKGTDLCLKFKYSSKSILHRTKNVSWYFSLYGLVLSSHTFLCFNFVFH